MIRRISPERCWGVIIDVQEFFLAQMENPAARTRMEKGIGHFARLLNHFCIPIVVTLERPLRAKGAVPKSLRRKLGEGAHVFQKDFFDLSKEQAIADHIDRLQRKQAVLAGCETDVCVLQSCLGLLELGHEVYVVEDLLFSSTRKVEAALQRMQAEGVVLLTYKTLYYELLAAVDGGPHAKDLLARFGPLPNDLPDQLL